VFLTKLALPQGDAILANVRDVTAKKKADDELKAKSLSLEEVNAALKVLLRQREQDKDEMEGRIVDNVRKLVLPYVERLKENRLNDEQKACLNILETNLMNIVSSFVQKMASAYSHFTRSEILVANLIRDGKTIKEIARVSGVSENAVNRHRQNIRNKLGLNRRKVSLKAFLMSFN
jgi:DNA-binding NarL/FixJ family response regulator